MLKTIIYLIMILMAVAIGLFDLSWTYLIIPFGLAVGIVVNKYYTLFKSYRTGDWESFFRKVDQEIERERNENVVKQWKINKASALSVKGESQEAYELLKAIDESTLSKTMKIFYFANLIEVCLNSNKLDEARKIYDEKQELLHSKTLMSAVNKASKSAIATHYFYTDQLEKSKELFQELIKQFNTRKDPFAVAYIYYYLGMIELKNGNTEESNNNFDKAVSLGKNTSIPSEIEKIRGG